MTVRLDRVAGALGACGPILVVAAVLGGCGTFEDPAIVIDLRILGMTAEPPEQVSPFDPMNPLDVMFGPVEVCAIVADPAEVRALAWSMVACPPVGDRRCDDLSRPLHVMGEGTLDDPETAPTPQVACATLPPGPELIAILRDTIENDSLSGFGGIDVNIGLRVVPVGGGEAAAIYGAKAVRFSPLLPAGRVANTNPRLDQIAVDGGDGTTPAPLGLGRCVDQLAPLALGPAQTIHLDPIEPPGVREDYLVPTFEGGVRMFTENLRYEWLAGGGDWTRAGTGGPRDGAGNQPVLDTEWESPPADRLDGVTDVPLWVVQRDERGGARWFESCVRVTP